MKKELLTVRELEPELRMSPKAIRRASRKAEIPAQSSRSSLGVAPGYIGSPLDTSDEFP
jgi:hypothetical protein